MSDLKDVLAYEAGYEAGKRDSAPRWVRCEEERPEDLRVVIIHKEWDGEITLGYSYPGFEENMKLWMCLKTPYNQYEVPWVGAGHVDYWMPLPEPPKEGE